MRIAFLTSNQSKVGGAETYINSILPALAEEGHRIALCSEKAPTVNRKGIALPAEAQVFCVETQGAPECLNLLGSWLPDVLFVHGLSDSRWEEAILGVAPAVFYAHDYYGACISGSKTNQFPVLKQCYRTFGPSCLLQYYPRRCGGLNPITALKLYKLQDHRQVLLRRYKAVLTNSQHMASQLSKQGIDAECLYLFVENCSKEAMGVSTLSNSVAIKERPLRLLFLGRMEYLKGGSLLLDALPDVRKRLGRELHIVFAGGGPKGQSWSEQARRLQAICAGITVEFVGWVDETQRSQLLSESDLLVIPSLWPEPFGLVGLEAGRYGVPSVAFDVGGISEWLTEGVNGCLASSTPPTAASLSEAIVRATESDAQYNRIREGAVERSHFFSKKKHVRRLTEILEDARQKP